MRHLQSSTRTYSKAKLHNGEIVTGVSRAQLKSLVYKRLKELGETPPNYEAYFENAVCEALSPERAAVECRYVDKDSPEVIQKQRIVTMDDVWRFLRAMKNFIAGGATLVDQPEAERRALVCAQCPRNIEISGCKWCSGLVSAATEVMGGRTTSADGRLLSCEVCGCDNKAAVHFPLSTVDGSLDYPEWCWKREAVAGL